MRIKKVKFINDEQLGNLEFDFTSPDGKIYDNIILAGENGTCKTKILDSLASIAGNLYEKNFEFIIQFEESDIVFLLGVCEEKELFATFETTNREEILGFLDEIRVYPPNNTSHWGLCDYKTVGGRKTIGYNPYSRNQDLVGILLCSIVAKYKKNDKEPTFQEVSQTTKITVDDDTERKEKSRSRIIFANDLNTSELLVNINSQDAIDFQNSYFNDGVVDKTKLNSRINRFKNAFNNFFDNELKFVKIENFKIIFEKRNVLFTIDRLSSGERNIVQNGAFFLKDINLGEPSICVLDEPEQTLHPRWEDRILDYYKDIFNKGSEQSSQIFLATHSEYVLRDAYEANDLIIILTRDENGKIVFEKSPELNLFPNSPTYNEIKFRAFSLYTKDFHGELFGNIQEKINAELENGETSNISDMDDFFTGQDGCPLIPQGLANSRGDRSLPVYLRNCINHPESMNEPNPEREWPGQEKLKESTDFMVEIIRSLA